MIRRTQRSTLFPYTTLFRSRLSSSSSDRKKSQATCSDNLLSPARRGENTYGTSPIDSGRKAYSNSISSLYPRGFSLRSEEHTSELQSQSNLVCRLLLEKKKK